MKKTPSPKRPTQDRKTKSAAKPKGKTPTEQDETPPLPVPATPEQLSELAARIVAGGDSDPEALRKAMETALELTRLSQEAVIEDEERRLKRELDAMIQIEQEAQEDFDISRRTLPFNQGVYYITGVSNDKLGRALEYFRQFLPEAFDIPQAKADEAIEHFRQNGFSGEFEAVGMHNMFIDWQTAKKSGRKLLKRTFSIPLTANKNTLTAGRKTTDKAGEPRKPVAGKKARKAP